MSAHESDPDRGEPALFDFTQEEAARGWRSIDDVVMGGVSASRFASTGAGSAVFEGEVSLEHGGGFASVRSPDSIAEQSGLAGYGGLALDLRGDGRTYKLNVRLGREFDGLVWQHAFTPPAGERRLVRVRFDELAPTFRGRRVPTPERFDPTHITSLGLVIGDRQGGPFHLELWRIRAWRATERR
ncbi:MAG: CIA30 family protein [Planctomycetes bacterium]|nr:CIA30 family protein [Planctomycetota bacterium]